MKFYDCVTAPSPRRVRIFLAEKGLTVPTVQIGSCTTPTRPAPASRPPFDVSTPRATADASLYCAVA
jgi:glutathione S-transferase